VWTRQSRKSEQKKVYNLQKLQRNDFYTKPKKKKKEKCFAIPIRNNAMMETESKMTTTTVVVWEGMERQNNKTYV